MPYLHVRINDAQANGNYSLGMRRIAAQRQKSLSAMSVAELVENGCGFVNDLDHVPNMPYYETYRTEQITTEMAMQHAQALLTWEKENL